ncbi:MAG: O-methyltransferase [Actinobacteria bacterium]|nr:O-methyltransferase [Actinomycetota bacterium]
MAEAQLGTPSLTFVENWIEDDEPLIEARRTAAELGSPVPIGPAGGATLRVLAAAVGAKAIVEVGTGAGTSGIWLMRGMQPDGVFTTIDIEAEHQRAAKQAYAAAGIPANRYRLINGSAVDVLPRLTDGGYDLAFVDADKTGYPYYVEQAVRLLRPGGVLAVDNTLRRDGVADPSVRDEATVVTRDLLKSVHDDERLIPALLPVGDGLLVAVKR